SAAARTAFMDMLAAHGLDARVRLHPRVPFPAVRSILNRARTGVVPLPDVAKFRTNVPMKLFEYLAAGVPAVASDLPPSRALLGGTDAVLLVPPGDHAAFADALDGLLGDPLHAARLARRGRELVDERFHWEREERALLAVYSNLLAGPGLRAMARELHA